MNTRTKLLLAAMTVVAVSVFGDQAYRRFVEQPARRFDSDLSRVEKQLANARNIIIESASAADELATLEQYSLPYDPELARARYQEWLLNLVEQAGLRQPSVDAGAPVAVSIQDRQTRRPKEIYKRYSFSLRGRGTLEQITNLLFNFYQGGHLHKIRTLSLNPLAGGNQLDLSLGIEALGLARCEREAELSHVKAQRLAFDDVQAYRTIVRRNFFSRHEDSPLRQVVLSAVTFDRTGSPEAWFLLIDQRRTQVLRRGDRLAIPSHQVQVIDIQPEMVLVEVDGFAVRVPLGKSIYGTPAPPPETGGSARRTQLPPHPRTLRASQREWWPFRCEPVVVRTSCGSVGAEEWVRGIRTADQASPT